MVAHLQNRTSLKYKLSFAKEPPRQRTKTLQHGQIVFIGKILCNENWTSLSIPKGNSKEYNADKFAKPKHKQHFTDDYINEKTFK